MLKGLLNIVVKEVKELVRDPKILLGMIIVPLIMFPLMGFAIQTSMEAAEESMGNISMAVMDLDKGIVSENLTNFLTSKNVRIIKIDQLNFSEAVEYVQQSNLTVLMVVPPGFSNDTMEGVKVDLEVFTVFRGVGLAESTLSSVISALLNEFEYGLIVQKVGEEIPSQDPETVLNPISLFEKTIIKGKAVNIHPNIFFGLMAAQSTGMPVGVMMLLIFAMQLAATSVASEKEEKTLETLLTLPVNRFTILVGKLTGSIIVAVVGAVAYIIGFSYYMGSFSGIMPAGIDVDLASIGLAPTPLSYLLLGVSLFMALLSALALAISISVFAEDVRGAQALVGPLSILLVFPMIFTMFTDIHALPLPLMIVLFAIPFTHPMLAAKITITGDYLTAVLGIVYVSIFTVAILYIAAKLFGTEKILTAKLKFRRLRFRKSKSPT
ncbi:MAG: ABC transporter permease [Candidatus Bathyarchaeota archaeon]